MTNKPMTVTTRNVTVRDFVIFQLKLTLDGTKDFVAFWFSIGAIILDFISGRGKRPRLFYSVMRASERFDKWLNLHSVLQKMDELESEDGIFGGIDEDEDTLASEIEKLVRRSSLGREEALRRLKASADELRGKGGAGDGPPAE